jgi:hypothetical protein
MRVRTEGHPQLRFTRWQQDRRVARGGVTGSMVSVCLISFPTATSRYEYESYPCPSPAALALPERWKGGLFSGLTDLRTD